MKLISAPHVVILFIFEAPVPVRFPLYCTLLKGHAKCWILQKASFNSNPWNLPFLSTLKATTLFYIIVDYYNCYLRHT